ncbi:hypothetical protein [Galbibacter sp.]|uniref:hypothetical protein n=1 Tax=Galbibacter sp. TaxID=2918471 RepID=UPI003A9199F0
MESFKIEMMKKQLEEELKLLAQRVLNKQGAGDVLVLHAQAQKLYEKLTLLKYVETYFGELQTSENKHEIADRFEIMANEVLRGNTDVPESNPNADEEDIMTPVMETIKDLVDEMPEEETLEDLLAGILPQPTFVKRDSESVTPKSSEVDTIIANNVSTPREFSAQGGFKIGLNDKIAFIKHLFNDSSEDYVRVVSQINTIDSFENAQQFIDSMVKPDYNHWEGKEAYETRFMTIIEQKFS